MNYKKTKYINQNDPKLNFELIEIEDRLNSKFRFFTNRNSKKEIGIGNMCRKTEPCVHDVCFKISNRSGETELQLQERRYNLRDIAKMLNIDYQDLKDVHKFPPDRLVEDGDYKIEKEI